MGGQAHALERCSDKHRRSGHKACQKADVLWARRDIGIEWGVCMDSMYQLTDGRRSRIV